MTESDLSGFQRALASALPSYEIPDDDLVGEVLIPALKHADAVWIAAGFFSSRCLAQIAPGLAIFLRRPRAGLRLLASPEIAFEDRAAIDEGLRSPEKVLDSRIVQLLTEAETSGSEVEQHCVRCLAYLVAAGRLEIRIVLMRRGMYHKKQWLIRSREDWLGVHGSGNATRRGLLVNGEQMTIDRAWNDGEVVAMRVDRLVSQFNAQWANEGRHSLTVRAEQALRLLASREGWDERPPTVADFWAAWQADFEAGLEPPLPPNALLPHAVARFRIPPLEWRSGRFEHQGRAVDAFSVAGRGIFSIATGGGKTKAALISATQLQDESERPLLVIVLVPSRPLIRQWADEVQDFGVSPTVLSGMSPAERRKALGRIEAALASGEGHTEVILASGRLFGSDGHLSAWVARVADSTETLLIADEVHNLGTASFLTNRPESVRYRLGLSATPVRQYDPEGTQELRAFFGDVLIEFTIGDAIKSGCLVPYEYHVHFVDLTHDEAELYSDLSEELRRLGFRVDDDGESVALTARMERLLRRRRAVVEQAAGKIDELRRLLSIGDVTRIGRTLIYASAKPVALHGPRQIDQVNELLADLGVVSHQFTSVETSRANAQSILDAFGKGTYQTLTAMKVLDEGVDIPQTETAYLLASSSVRREWIQRRGRVLRRWPGKERARLHDFAVVPPDPLDSAGESLLRSELRRVEEFSQVSLNEFDPGGGYDSVQALENKLRRHSDR